MQPPPLLDRRTLLALAASPWPAGAATAPILIAVDSHNPPFMHAGRDGRPRGVYPVLLQALFAQLGKPLRIVCLPWPRALAGLERGEHGVGGLYATAERRARHDFSQPLHVETLRVYARRGSLRLFDRIEDLRGLRVGVLRGWSYGDAFDAAVRGRSFGVETVAADAQNFGKLERGFLDVAIAIEEAGNALLASGAYPSVRALPNPLAENPSHLAFNKSAGRGELLARLDQALAQLRRSGEHARLVGQGLRD